MKRVIAFMIALAVCVGLFVPFATSTNTIAAETLQISVDRTEIASGEALTVSFTGLAANMHNGKDVYSIRVVGGSSKNISDGGKQTVGADGSGEVVFEGLAIGSHTVQLRKWNATSDFTTLQEITVTVKKARPTISVQDTEISVGDTLKVYVNTVGNVHYGDVYSIAISGPSSASKNISDGSKYTYTGESVDFTGLQEGLYSVKLRYWNNNEGVVAIQTIEVQATKIRPVISIKDTNLTAGDTLKIYVDASAGNVHYGDAYSIQISGPSTAAKDISNGSKFTYAGETVDFADVKAGSYTVKLRYWNEGEGVVAIQTLTVDVGKVRPTISVADRDLTAGDSLTVSVGNTTAVTHDGTEVYSVRIVGGTSVNVSNGSAFTKDLVTFENLKAGTYTIQLRVWSEKTDFTTLQELTITVKDKPLAISVSKETLKAGESITISYEGLSDSLLTDKDVYSIWFGTTSGTKLNEWNLWDTSTSLGENNSFSVYVKSAGSYVVRLRVWNADTSALDVLQEITVTVEKAVQLGGSIQAGKTQYVAGEVQYFSYQFDDAADVTNIGNRSIKIYNGSTLVFEWTSRNSANGGSSSNEWIDLKNASLAGKPGTYTMKVVIYGTDTLYPGYEDMTYTYTVVERTEGTTPAQPTISVPKTTYLSYDQIDITFDGMSMHALDYSTYYRVSVYNAAGTSLGNWVLWNCGNVYEGLYGTKTYSDALPIGNYTVVLETSTNGKDYAAVQTIEILVKKAALAAQPELKESITMHYTVMLGADVTGTPVMTYVYNGEEIVVEGSLVGDNAYMFALEGILPQDMGKTIDAYVSIDGTEITRYEGYSVRQYCLNQLEKTDDANLKALLVALLNYGTQAQGYFGSADAVINDGLDQSLLTDYLAGKGYDASNPAGNVAAPVTGTNAGDYVWKAATLGLYDTIKIRVKFQATSVEGLKVVAGGQEYTEFVSAGTNLWYVYIPVYAADFAESLTITFQDSTGIVGATLTYSVNTYIKYAMDNGAAEVKPLVEAIYYYGVLAGERA